MAIEGLESVALGREGSGQAQIVDTSGIVNHFAKLQERKLATDIANADKAAKALARAAKTLDLGGTPHHMDLDEYGAVREHYIDNITKLMNSGENLDDPNSQAAKTLRDAKMKLQAFENISKKNGALYEVAKSKLGDAENWNQDHLVKQLEAYQNAKSTKERIEIANNFLVPELNVDEMIGQVATAAYTNVTETPDGITRTYVRPDETKIRASALRVAQDDPGGLKRQRGIDLGHWKDLETEVDFLVEQAMADMDETDKINLPSDKSGGLNLNFVDGGGVMESNGWRIGLYDKEYTDENRLGDKEVTKKPAVSFAYKDKNPPMISLYTDPDPETGEVKMRRGIMNSVIIDKDTPANSEIRFKVATTDKDGNMVIMDDSMPTISLRMNADNKEQIRLMTGFDLDEAIRNIGSKKTSSKKGRQEVADPDMGEEKEEEKALTPEEQFLIDSGLTPR